MFDFNISQCLKGHLEGRLEFIGKCERPSRDEIKIRTLSLTSRALAIPNVTKDPGGSGEKVCSSHRWLAHTRRL